MNGAVRRINKELADINNYSPENCCARPIDSDIYHWKGTIMGPTNTPYTGARFFLDVVYPTDYPFKPPVILYTGI